MRSYEEKLAFLEKPVNVKIEVSLLPMIGKRFCRLSIVIDEPIRRNDQFFRQGYVFRGQIKITLDNWTNAHGREGRLIGSDRLTSRTIRSPPAQASPFPNRASFLFRTPAFGRALAQPFRPARTFFPRALSSPNYRHFPTPLPKKIILLSIVRRCLLRE